MYKRQLQVWVNEVFDCKANKLDVPLPGTNANIRWAADMSTQILDLSLIHIEMCIRDRS